MRVLFVSDVYFPRVNGVSTSIRTFRGDLAREGVETILIAPAYPGAAADTATTVDRVIAAAHTPTIHARHGIQMVSTRGPPFLEPARSIP